MKLRLNPFCFSNNIQFRTFWFFFFFNLNNRSIVLVPVGISLEPSREREREWQEGKKTRIAWKEKNKWCFCHSSLPKVQSLINGIKLKKKSHQINGSIHPNQKYFFRDNLNCHFWAIFLIFFAGSVSMSNDFFV